MNTTATATETPVMSTRTQIQTYSRMAAGYDPNSSYIQLLGITSGKSAGEPRVGARQSGPASVGAWTASKQNLSPSTNAQILSDLAMCEGTNTTYALGIADNGALQPVGKLTNGTWTAANGDLLGSELFKPGTLTAQGLIRPTFFAVTNTNLPVVAATVDATGAWQKGHALPLSVLEGFASIAARPDLGTRGTTRAIGLTLTGRACEVATEVNSLAVPVWSQGKGILGSSTGLPTFTHLLLITGDAASVFHVIGLGSDGSVWDIDQYNPAAGVTAWSGQSHQISPAKTVTGGRIDFYLEVSGTGFTINLVGWQDSSLTNFATFGTSWTASTGVIPTSGVTQQWRIVNNLANGTDAFVLGLSGIGHMHELSYYKAGTWAAGTQVPLNG